jgi:hypothetical protein
MRVEKPYVGLQMGTGNRKQTRNVQRPRQWRKTVLEANGAQRTVALGRKK